MLNNQITLYKNALDNVGRTITVGEAIKLITSGKYDKQIQALRKVTDKDANSDLKKKLPAVTWSGTFTKRSVKGIQTYSNLICIDIDKLTPEQLSATRATLMQDPHVFFMFISPNGNGLKVLFTFDGEPENHAHIFALCEAYFKETYSITIDKACKDVSRLCFLSSDTTAYINEDCQPFYYVPDALDTDKVPLPAGDTSTDIMDQLFAFTSRVQTFAEGNKNNFIHVYACNANRHDVDADRVINYFAGLGTADDLTTATITNAYKRNTHERGKYANASLTHSRHQSPATRHQSLAPQISRDTEVDDSVLFWDLIDTGKTKHKVDEKTGEIIGVIPVTRLQYSFDNAIKFINNNGFWKYRVGKDSFILIRVVNNIIDILPTEQGNKLKTNVVKHFMLQYLESKPEEYKPIREIFRKNAPKYTSLDQLDQLPFFPHRVEKLDTPDTAYLYFRNCFIRVRATGVEVLDYAQLGGYIWSSQIIDRDYVDTGTTVGVAQDFIYSAILGKRYDPAADATEIEQQRIKATCTALGYMIHNYKDPTVNKAVIATDGALRQGSDSNGGSGKSVLGVMLSKIVSTCDIDGKAYDPKDKFCLDLLNPDHRILFFNDVLKTFSFDSLFNILTNTMVYKKVYTGSISIPYSESPKVYIATNYSLKGPDSSSYIRRQAVIEFSDYFNENNRPVELYGHRFFDDWDRAEHAGEWDRFYTFFIFCLRMYLMLGLVDFPTQNYAINKLMDDTGEEFMEWAEDYINEAATKRTGPLHDGRIDRKEMFAHFLSACPSYKMKITTWGKWVRRWCALNDIDVNKNVTVDDHGRHKSGGVEYYYFTKKEK